VEIITQEDCDGKKEIDYKIIKKIVKYYVKYAARPEIAPDPTEFMKSALNSENLNLLPPETKEYINHIGGIKRIKRYVMEEVLVHTPRVSNHVRNYNLGLEDEEEFDDDLF